jgi:hypothetical protein
LWITYIFYTLKGGVILKECKECGGTGLVVNDKYCKCIDGRLLKAKHTATLKAVVTSKEDKTAAKVEKLQEENKRIRRIPLIVGDWVQFQDRVGIVTIIDEYNNQFRLEAPTKPYAAAWVTYNGQTPLPLERFNDPATLRQLVDMALMFKDKDWFNELTGGKNK